MARAGAGDETASMISPIPTMACLGGILVDPISRAASTLAPDSAALAGSMANKTENESRDGPNHKLQSIGWYLSLAEGPFRRRRSAVVIHLSASTSNESAGNQAQIFDRARIDDRIDARRGLSLGGKAIGDTALVGPRKAFAKCNRRKLNSLRSNTWSLSRCEIAGGAAPPQMSRDDKCGAK